MTPSGWPAALSTARLHVVTGKGGTGKTTVAAALALALAAGGRRTLLSRWRTGRASPGCSTRAPLPYEERKIAVAPGGGEVRALAVDVEAALLEYFEMFYNLGFAGRTLRRMGAVEFATTLAPGLRDVLLTGKVKETRHPHRARRPAGLRRGGAGRAADRPGRHASSTSPRRWPTWPSAARSTARARAWCGCCTPPDTVVHLVTLLEDMPVTETLEARRPSCDAADLPVGAVIVNRGARSGCPTARWPPRPTAGWTPARLRAGLAAAGLDLPADVLDGLVAEAVEHAVRVHGRGAALARLRRGAPALPLLELPRAGRRRRPRRAVRAGRGAGRAGGAACRSAAAWRP